MLLVIDAGNTNIVFAVHDGMEWRGTWRLATLSQRTSDEYGVWLEALLTRAGISPHDVQRAVIGTVVPAALYHLRRLCREWFSVEPLVARASLQWGFAIKTDNPDDVGADRLLNALAAHHQYKGPLVVVDFGTATTFDVVDEDGAYIGGVIAPGINLSIEALHQAAARLPRIGIGRPQSVIGRATVPITARSTAWADMPVRVSRASSQTPYSSEVRCAEVARRHVPRHSLPSWTAKTMLVLPASMTKSMALSFMRNRAKPPRY